MADETYTLTAESVGLVNDLLRRAADTPQNDPDQPLDPPAGRPANLQTLRVTGGASAGPGGLNYYPALIESIDRDAGTWGTMAGTDAVWVLEPAAGGLSSRRYGHCRQIADQVTVSGDARPLFEVNGAPSGLSVTKTVVVAFDPDTCEVTTEDWTFVDGVLTAVA